MTSRSFVGRAALRLALLAFGFIPQPGIAQQTAAARSQAMHTAEAAAMKAMIKGPTTVALVDQAKLELPEAYGYIPRKEAADLLTAMGNSIGDRFIGVVMPLGENEQHWFATLSYEPSGYIKDDDARHWKSDELLESLKDGTEAGNERRRSMGIPEIVVTRWIESPAYAPDTHHLVWSVEVNRKNGAATDPGVNYNTYVLGREGYVSMDVVTQASNVEHDKDSARRLLSLVSFNPGKDYGSFNSSTDKVAAYGLAALVAGVAVKKLGLLALAGAAIVKFAKLIALAVAAFFAGVRKWLKSRAKREPGAPA
jgi:uncharacterized membrane-anchored protein